MTKREEAAIKAIVANVNGRKKRAALNNPPWPRKTSGTYVSQG